MILIKQQGFWTLLKFQVHQAIGDPMLKTNRGPSPSSAWAKAPFTVRDVDSPLPNDGISDLLSG